MLRGQIQLLVLSGFLLGAAPKPDIIWVPVDIPGWKNGDSEKDIQYVPVARHVKKPLLEALSCIVEKKKPLLLQYNGAFVTRHKRTVPGEWSEHAYGKAIDINAHLEKQLPEVVECFEKAGWKWGGRWKNPDEMHFEWRR